MIKAAKKAIRAVLGNADVNDEEQMTAFVGVEALLNFRPLTYQSADPKDATPLTPNHFLHGQTGGVSAPEEVEFSPRNRWRRVQELISHFWRRWMREWLPLLSARRKWTESKPNLKIGDIGLAISPDCPRAHWPLGRVLEVFLGQNGRVRLSMIQNGWNTVMRPASKCVLLESNKEERLFIVMKLTESRGGECLKDTVVVRLRLVNFANYVTNKGHCFSRVTQSIIAS